MTGLAALLPIHATLEKEIVTQIMIVLEILFVDITTAQLGILAWIAVLPLLAPLQLAILAVFMTGWRCPMDPTLKSFVAIPSQDPSPALVQP